MYYDIIYIIIYIIFNILLILSSPPHLLLQLVTSHFADVMHVMHVMPALTEERIRSNLSKTKNIPPKALIFSDFCCTFAMSLMIISDGLRTDYR